MPARSLASVTLSFGLVTVPVNIFTARESSSKISFNWINKKTGGRVRQKYFDPESGEVVPRTELIKGYEFQKGQYVLFETEELKVLEAEGNQTIDIVEFILRDQVDRIYLDKFYYLGPDKGGDKAYHLLKAALKKTQRCALARYSARGKQYLVLICPMGDGLIMEQLHYHDEIKLFSEIALGNSKVKKSELDLAVKLIENGAAENFKPENYHDEVRQRVLETIQKKIDGQDITEVKQSPQKKVVDLMEALKASVGTSKSSSKSTKKKKSKGRVA